jgi:hypothetical protein
MGSLALSAEKTYELDGLVVGKAEPVRGVGVEFGRFAR